MAIEWMPIKPEEGSSEGASRVQWTPVAPSTPTTTPGSKFLEYNPFSKTGIMPNPVASQFYSGLVSSATSPLTVLGTPVGWVNKGAGETVKNFLHVKPEAEAPTNMAERVAGTAGGLIGMAAPLGVLKVGKIGRVLKGLSPYAQSAVIGALWGATEDSGQEAGSIDDLKTRVANAARQSAVFTTLHGAGVGVEAIMKKIPGLEKALSNLKPEHLQAVNELVKQGTLGAGLGAMEPAEGGGERLTNALAGALGFQLGAVPGMVSNARGIVKDRKVQQSANFKQAVEGAMPYSDKMADQTMARPISMQELQAKLKERRIMEKADMMKEGQSYQLNSLDLPEPVVNEIKTLENDQVLKMRRRWMNETQLEDPIGANSVNPNNYNMTLKKLMLDGTYQKNPKMFSTVVTQTLDKDLWNYKGHDYSTSDLAFLVLDNPDVFPDGANSLKILRTTDAQKGSYRIVNNNKDNELRDLRGKVGQHLVDYKGKISVYQANPVTEPSSSPATETNKVDTKAETFAQKPGVEESKSAIEKVFKTNLKKHTGGFDRPIAPDSMLSGPRTMAFFHKPKSRALPEGYNLDWKRDGSAYAVRDASGEVISVGEYKAGEEKKYGWHSTKEEAIKKALEWIDSTQKAEPKSTPPMPDKFKRELEREAASGPATTEARDIAKAQLMFRTKSGSTFGQDKMETAEMVSIIRDALLNNKTIPTAILAREDFQRVAGAIKTKLAEQGIEVPKLNRWPGAENVEDADVPSRSSATLGGKDGTPSIEDVQKMERIKEFFKTGEVAGSTYKDYNELVESAKGGKQENKVEEEIDASRVFQKEMLNSVLKKHGLPEGVDLKDIPADVVREIRDSVDTIPQTQSLNDMEIDAWYGLRNKIEMDLYDQKHDMELLSLILKEQQLDPELQRTTIEYLEKGGKNPYEIKAAIDNMKGKKKLDSKEMTKILAYIRASAQTEKPTLSLKEASYPAHVESLKDGTVSAAELSEAFGKTKQTQRFWMGGRPWKYYEVGKSRFLVDGDLIMNPDMGTKFPIKGEVNHPSTVADTSTTGVEKHTGGLDKAIAPDTALSAPRTMAFFHKKGPTRADIYDIENAPTESMRDHMARNTAAKTRGGWLNWEPMANWLRNRQDIFNKEVQAAEKIERIPIAQDVRSVHMSKITNEIHDVMEKYGVDEMKSKEWMLALENVVVNPNFDKNWKGDWVYAENAPLLKKDLVDNFRLNNPELFKIGLEWKNVIDRDTWEHLRHRDADLAVWEQRRRNGYFPHEAKLNTEEAQQRWSKFSMKSDAERASFEKARDYGTLEEFWDACEKEGLEPNNDIAEVIAKRATEGQFRIVLDETLKDLANTPSDTPGLNLLAYPTEKMNASMLRKLGYIEVGKQVRWLNSLMPSGASMEAFVHPEIAKEFRYLYENAGINQIKAVQGFKTLQGKVKSMLLWHPGFVMFDIVGGQMAILGPKKFAEVVGKTSSLGKVFGKTEQTQMLTPEEYTEALKTGLVLNKDLIQQSWDIKFKEAANSFFNKKARGPVKDTLKYIFEDHLGTNDWLWSTLDNFAGQSWKVLRERYEKKGMSKELAGRMAAMIVNDNIQNLPSRTWDKQTSSLMGLLLLAKSYTTATLRIATGAFPMLEKAFPWKPLRHNISDPVARKVMADTYKDVLVKQALGMIFVSNIMNLAFTGKLTTENEEGHKFDIQLPMEDKGQKIYINVPFFRQFESLVKSMPEVVGDNIGLRHETSSLKWFKNKMDPVLREAISQISNYDEYMHQTIRDQAATAEENAMSTLTHAVGAVSPMPIGNKAKDRTMFESFVAPALGTRTGRGFPGGAEAKNIQEKIARKDFETEQVRRQLSRTKRGTPEYARLQMELMKSPGSAKNMMLRESDPLSYWMMRGKQKKVEFD